MNQIYLDTARLLTQVAPLVITDGTFALKGGTAINLFIRDMPRLSVDLDLVFPDYSLPRDQTLAPSAMPSGTRPSTCKRVDFRRTPSLQPMPAKPNCWCGATASRSRSKSIL